MKSGVNIGIKLMGVAVMVASLWGQAPTPAKPTPKKEVELVDKQAIQLASGVVRETKQAIQIWNEREQNAKQQALNLQTQLRMQEQQLQQTYREVRDRVCAKGEELNMQTWGCVAPPKEREKK